MTWLHVMHASFGSIASVLPIKVRPDHQHYQHDREWYSWYDGVVDNTVF